jgi:Uma2 family endonuclease
MTTETIALAPWGEVIPGDHLLTVDELLARPDDGCRYELVEGRLIRMPPAGGYSATQLAVRLILALGNYLTTHPVGSITAPDGTYEIGPRTGLVPDVGFIRAARVPPPGSPAHERAIAGAPDLAVEIASPTQYRPEMAAKARHYLAAGTSLVWVVWPRRKQVDVWRPGDLKPSRTLKIGDELVGEDIIPGFHYPLAQLFAFS